MQWANRTNCANPVTGGEPLSGWGNETNFENAFQEVPGKSKKYCYNMPFTRRPSGLWEFDANYLCKDGVTTDYNSTYNSGCGASQGGVGNVGGFYNMKASDGTVLGVPTTGMQQGSNSTSYPTGQYTGNRVGVLPDYQWCFDRGQSGKGTNCTGLYPTGPGPNQTLSEMAVAHCPDFGKEDDPNATAAEKAACPYNGDSRPKGVRGGHLCFESQEAEFIYNPGQEFFSRGDDDIWVFINNQLVIDIGGNHMPAPGYVKLDTISVPEKLVAGHKYPIKIFFCDRRGPGSNVRIATNMYFSQKSGLFLKEGAAQSLGDVCLETSGGGSCGSESSGPTQQCGPELKDKLNYYIARRDGSNKLNLNANTPECSASGNTLTCFKSITIDFNNGKVQVLPVSQGLVGTWVVYAEVLGIEPKPAPLKLGTVIGKNTIDNNDPSSSSGGGQPLSPSSSSNEVSPIAQISQTMIQAQEPLYYNLKGEPLGTKKPSKAGVYIAYQKGKSKVIAVK
jgi:fibro-slime domain-containing protein